MVLHTRFKSDLLAKMNLLANKSEFSAKVSSVLNKNVKEFGKQFLFDGREDTCWNSDQGSPQTILISFQKPHAKISQLQIQFQGGFVGTQCHVIVNNDKKVDFFPEDTNKLQTFPIELTDINQLKITFGGSTDFFGRITVYQLNLFE